MNLLATNRRENLKVHYEKMAELMVDTKEIQTFRDVEQAVKPYHLIGIDAKTFIADIKKIHTDNKGDKVSLKEAIAALLKRCIILKDEDYPAFRLENEVNGLIFELQTSLGNREAMIEEVEVFLKNQNNHYRIQHEAGNLGEFITAVQGVLIEQEYYEEQSNDIKKLFHLHFELTEVKSEQVTEKAIRTFSVWRTKQNKN